jgi:hypothetical protein
MESTGEKEPAFQERVAINRKNWRNKFVAAK